MINCFQFRFMLTYNFNLRRYTLDTSTSTAAGVVGHRSCATMDITGVTVPVPYAATADPASFEARPTTAPTRHAYSTPRLHVVCCRVTEQTWMWRWCCGQGLARVTRYDIVILSTR